MTTSTGTPVLLINAVGLTSRWLPHAPRFRRLAELGWSRDLKEVLPAVTSTAQASLLTGALPRQHGIVGNGWLFRDTMEIRFWQQSNRLLGAEPIYNAAKRMAQMRGEKFRCAKLFWWFNQGANVDISVTPKPHYGCDGNKIFGITGSPRPLVDKLEKELGPFPFQSFWGPMAGLPATEWIARCAAEVLKAERPNLTLVYLPHLDYGPQRHGPTGCDMPKLVGELDQAATPLLEAADSIGARVFVVSEYGHCDVEKPVYPNLILRRAGLLEVRQGPFGEMLDTFESRAFAVCDHQLCHVYVRDTNDLIQVQEKLKADPGVDRVLVGSHRHEIGLDHPRSGEIVALSKPDRWFAYPYWLEDRKAPDFARTVDIHRKPGFDPCEMFFDPKMLMPQAKAALRLVQKKLGFRTKFDVTPLDATIVHGSHGLPAKDPMDRPIFIGEGPEPPGNIGLQQVHGHLLSQLFDR